MALELSNEETAFNEVNFLTVENDLLNASRKSKTPQSEGKENKTPKDKVGRVSRKSVKEPLKPITNEGKSPSARKTNGKSPAKGKKDKKTQTVPKIVVYKDDEPPEAKGKSSRKVSKSLDGRRSLPESGASQQGTAAPPKKNRHSFNDLPSLDSSRKRKPPGETSTKSPRLKPTDPEFLKLLSKLETLFPSVDPEYLKTQFVKFKCSLSDVMEFLLLKENTNELPTKADYLRRFETEKLQSKFLESFSVENFLKLIPDPWDHFLRAERHNCIKYAEHSLHYLKNKFKKHYIQAIQDALLKNGHCLYLAHKELNKKNRLLKMRITNRSKYECDVGKPLTFNLQFIQEVAFIENETKIKAHIKKANTVKQKRIEKAQKEGALLECHSCTEANLLADDVLTCLGNHVFCKDCVVKFVEIDVEKDGYRFKCLVKCEETFSLESLQATLTPFAVSQIIERNKIGEIKKAGMEDLVYCPFCYHLTAMPPELTVVKCLNPNCLMETCRQCKKLNHIPLQCHELGQSDETVPTERETEQPLKCIHCDKEYVKREDSNRMDCPCGGTMCSVCRQPFPECPHFKEPHTEPRETPDRLSSSSEDTEYTVEDTNDQDEGVSNGDNEDTPNGHFDLFISGSDAF